MSASMRESLATRSEPTDLFGRERSDQLIGIIGAIEQTFAANRCILFSICPNTIEASLQTNELQNDAGSWA